ncbi:MAG: T9SS type A sorting domain-containing protein [Ferruginibacter sp.]
MNNSTPISAQRLMKSLIALLIMTALIPAASVAQFRNYGIIYSENLKGNTVLCGNTLEAIVRTSNGTVNTTKMNENSADGNSQYGNDDENMQYVDVDGTTGNGAGTRNSSISKLVLPASGTNTIKMARLYWGGRVTNSDFNSFTGNKNIKISYGSTYGNIGAYTELGALQLDSQQVGTYFRYQMYTDITSIVQTNGTGYYRVGNAPLTVGAVSGGGNYGGWCIVVVYENPTLPFSSVRVYDGFQQVYNGGAVLNTSVTLTGLDVPSGALTNTDAKMGVMVWEGDANLTADYLKINGNTFSNGKNPSNNPWNGTISSFAAHDTTKFPNYTNQMALDIDQFYVGTGYGINPNATSVNLEFGTEADQYFPGLFTFVIKMKDPTITLDKTVTDASGNSQPEGGEVLTYKLKGKNLGIGNANQIIITDTLPNTMTYIPGTLKVNYCPGVALGAKSDAAADDHGEYIVSGIYKTIQFRLGNGSNGTIAGWIASLDSFEVEFKVTVNTPITGIIPPIINFARVKAKSDANIDYTDDGIAILNPQGGPLPVLLSLFNANLIGSNLVKVNWASSMEINSSRYDVERSIDGRNFRTVNSIAAAGNSSSTLQYAINDDISGITEAIVYYRLKQYDLDGKTAVSKVVSIRLRKDIKDLVVTPNPFHSYININMEWSKNETTVVKVFNMNGAEVVSKNVQMIKGNNLIRIDELSNLAGGTYMLQFNTPEGRVVKKITRQ